MSMVKYSVFVWSWSLLFFSFVGESFADEATTELDFSCMQEAYPGVFSRIEKDTEGRVWFVLSGEKRERILYDDGIERPYPVQLERGTLKESLAQTYSSEPIRPDLKKDEDPGRIRSRSLLDILYGATQKAVEQQLVIRRFAGVSVRVAPVVWERLEAMQPELSAFLQAQPQLADYFSPFYSYTWRQIAGTARRSPHSYGIALDVNPEKATYWRWSSLRPHPDQKRFPSALVALFEKYGFIWGGKWEHYDLMHFEYRPELLIKARKLSSSSAISKE